MDQLELTDDGLRLREDGDLFTGHLVDFYSGTNQQMKSKSRVEAGKLNGLSTGWFESGQKQVQEHFVQGVSDGKRIKWHENGAKSAEETIKDGELNGLLMKWHDNGQKAESMEMVDGKPHGLAKAWYPSGAVKAIVTLNMGEVETQEFWKDGEKVDALVEPEAQLN